MWGVSGDDDGQPVLVQELRVAAYAVCIHEGKILLARFVGTSGKHWTLPGGGIDHGEDPLAAAVREVEEETGYDVVIESLLGVDSMRRRFPRGVGIEADHHAVRVIYTARVVGGVLRHEIGGSTDQAAWIDLDQIDTLERVDLIDIALDLARNRPPSGRVDAQRT